MRVLQAKESVCVRLYYGIDLRRIISNYDRRRLSVFGVVTNEGRGRVDERIKPQEWLGESHSTLVIDTVDDSPLCVL